MAAYWPSWIGKQSSSETCCSTAGTPGFMGTSRIILDTRYHYDGGTGGTIERWDLVLQSNGKPEWELAR